MCALSPARSVFKCLMASVVLAGALVATTQVEAEASTGWEVWPSPNVGINDNALLGVAATSATNAWAVGVFFTGDLGQTLIEHWNGTTWEVQPSPNVGSRRNVLNGVAATSATNAWAVGAFNYNGSPRQTLIEHWDGTAWSVQPSPNPGSYSSTLSGVAATSATDAWAVGHSFNGFGTTDQTLIEHWDGTVWTVQPSPNVPHTNNDLNGVAATSGTHAWAVGDYFADTAHGLHVSRTLVEHWNGTAWTVQPSPNVGRIENALFGVAATSGTNAWAVGYSFNGGPPLTLIEHWNGTAWVVQPSPNVGNNTNALFGVAATSGTDAWAVGHYRAYTATNPGADRNLIEHCC